jgi:hypothetical protein
MLGMSISPPNLRGPILWLDVTDLPYRDLTELGNCIRRIAVVNECVVRADVVKHTEISKLANVQYVQTYVINSSKVIFIRCR